MPSSIHLPRQLAGLLCSLNIQGEADELLLSNERANSISSIYAKDLICGVTPHYTRLMTAIQWLTDERVCSLVLYTRISQIVHYFSPPLLSSRVIVDMDPNLIAQLTNSAGQNQYVSQSTHQGHLIGGIGQPAGALEQGNYITERIRATNAPSKTPSAPPRSPPP